MTENAKCIRCPPLSELPACEDREWSRMAIGILQGDGRRPYREMLETFIDTGEFRNVDAA